jgi:hypothetical protein
MSKQIIQSQGNIVEKVLRDKEGKLIRARFFVYENGGRIKARLLDFVYVTINELPGKVSALLGIVSRKIKNVFSVLNFEFSTFNLELSDIYSIGSKPRAPTH